jgi:imidazoleglycerol phosphate dehydratase HisB
MISSLKKQKLHIRAESRSKSIEYALREALQIKKLERLKSLIGKVEFDEETMQRVRDSER